MSFWRVLLAIIFPPLSVVDKGCGSFLIIFILTILGWIPGVIGALIILNNPNR
jgi:ric1 protein